MTRTRILVADSLHIFRAGVRNLLARESDLQVIEAGTLDEVLHAIEHECPDVVLIDLDLPPFGGVAAVQELERRCSTHMIVWSFEPSRETVLAAVRAGAHGFLHKDISPEGLVRALRGVVQGEAPLSRDLASLMIERAARPRRAHPRPRPSCGAVAAGARSARPGRTRGAEQTDRSGTSDLRVHRQTACAEHLAKARGDVATGRGNVLQEGVRPGGDPRDGSAVRMTTTAHLHLNGRIRPLVAVVCSVPLLGEGVGSVLEFADVRSFSDRGGDIAGLLGWLRPDVAIVDSEAAATEAAAYALEHPLPLLHIAVREQKLKLFVAGAWEYVGNGEGPSPEMIRNVVAGALFAGEGRIQ